MPGDEVEPRPLGPSSVARERLSPVPVPTEAPARWVAIDAIGVPERFCLRAARGASVLAEAIARDGQREPLLLRRTVTGALELVCGARRLEALRLLQRDRALARVEEDLDEGEATYLALCEALDREGLDDREIEALRARLDEENRLDLRVSALFARVEKMQQLRIAEGPTTKTRQGLLHGDAEVEEVDLEVLAGRARDGLADACNDLSALHEAWTDLDEGRREDLLECIRYLAAMLPLLEEPLDDEETFS